MGIFKDWNEQTIAQRESRIFGKKTESEFTPDEGLESELHEKIINECKRRVWFYVHSRMDMRSTVAKGTADFIIFADNGKVIVVEAKTKTGKLTPEQIGFAMWLEKLGHKCHCIRSFDEFLSLC